MKAIIAGTRYFDDYGLLCRTLGAWPPSDLQGLPEPITEVVSGCAMGADRLGERWAKERGVPIRIFPAEWAMHGRRAGYVRNSQMAEYADVLVAFWDGKSRGTAMMIDLMKRANKPVVVVRY